jgi:hypothetical protein
MAAFRETPLMKFIESIVLLRMRQETEAQWEDRDGVSAALLPGCRDAASIHHPTKRVVEFLVRPSSVHHHPILGAVLRVNVNALGKDLGKNSKSQNGS